MGKITDALEKYQEEIKPGFSPVNKGDIFTKAHPSNQKTQDIQPENPVSTATEPAKRVLFAESKLPETGKISLNENLITILRPQSYEAEQFRMLKSQILFPVSGQSLRSILVTSAVPGEGKSFVSANLAVSISQSINEYVLLVDCDIRKPSIHKLFGLENKTGLSEYLSDTIPLSSLLLKTDINKLTILPAGAPPENPAELLSSNKMTKLLNELKSRYQDRYVVIDTPPPKLTSETQVIAKQVDGVIIVVKYGSTPRKLISDLADMFGKEKILGVVFNMCSLKAASYGYHRYSEYKQYYASH